MKDLIDEKLRDCVNECWTCRDACQSTLTLYCLEKGGAHAAPEHVRMMLDCIQICQTSADFMTRNSAMHEYVCGACAEICDACADSCEQMDDERMKACAKECRACAKSCRDMGKAFKAAA